MAKWRIAESLKKLREQINEAYPGRSKASDGAIGDAAHASRSSDHNPWVKDGATGVVTAIDVTHDPRSGCTGDKIAAALIRSCDPRIKYIIFNRRILSSYGSQAWQWRPYTGANAHAKHIHISVLPEKRLYDSRDDWDLELDIAQSLELPADGSSDAIQQAEDTALVAISHSQPVVDGNDAQAASNEQETAKEAQPAEKIAIEKPPPQYFGTKMRNKIAGLTGGNFGLQAIRDWSEQAKLFGLSARFWFWVSAIALVATAVYLITQFYKHKVETKRDLELTQQLIQSNSTPENVVELVDSEKLSLYEAMKYKVIRR